jgi:beta-galactosidase
VDGYVGETLALSRSFSADPARDQWVMAADDAELVGDGVDATRVVVRVVDKFGAPRPFATGGIAFELSGPGLLVGDNPFLLGDAGGAGAVWVKTLPESSGRIVLKARHSSFGDKTVKIKVRESTDGIL